MKIVIAFMLTTAALLSSPAAKAIDSDTGAWMMLNMSDRISRDGETSRWRYSVDVQWRHSNRGAGSDQYVLRPAVGYDLNTAMSVWAGYGYFLSDPNAGSNVYEHRWWQQFSWSARKWDWGSLSLRTRLEERVRENGDDTAIRFRQQVQLAIPLPNRDLTGIVSTEAYVNTRDTDWGARSGFEQQRSYLGVRMPISNDWALQAGYMHQYIDRSAAENAVNHVAMFLLRGKF